MARTVRHVKSNVIFEIIQEENNYYVVIKSEEPDIKLRLEKFAVDGKMFKMDKTRGKKKTASTQKAKNTLREKQA